ncbi:hypothetical protein JZ751_029985 [Albula glossodonta]|uniref:G-protein coupled receptors family 1 profile domain-containing protein n=1 Tax=Albula glossodonta TaxID=121402 RepID=A0A8T2NKN1_9TELE|nr:hypothetical protein JZ751_029985 [Albula glossodonta]
MENELELEPLSSDMIRKTVLCPLDMLHLHTSSSNSSTTLNTGNLAPSMVLGLCCLVGVPGNIAVVVMIVRNFKTENFTLKLMLSLAVSDLLSLITMPMWIYDLLHGWKFGRTLMTKLVTSIVVTFFIFWIPLSVTNIIGLSGVWLESKTVDHLFDVMWEITGALTFINSCVNPFLYAFTARNLRQDNQQ